MSAQSIYNQLEFELTAYQRARQSEPRFYYNEMAAQGQALAVLRPLVENFGAGNADLASFVQAVSHFSRIEQARLRGLVAGQYWRLNAAGRLLLETLYKQAQSANRLNQAQNILQTALLLPVSLDAARQQIESLDHLLQDLAALTDKRAAKSGLIPYLLSYFWAIQSTHWPIFTPSLVTILKNNDQLPVNNKPANPADMYHRFYLACVALSARLQLNINELESFLNWLALRQPNKTRLNFNSTKRSIGRNSARRNARLRYNLERLAALLEPMLQAAIVSNLRAEIGRNHRLTVLTFGEPFQNFRLGIWPASNGSTFWEGLAFDGFGSVVFPEATAVSILALLQDYFKVADGYNFYATSPTLANDATSPSPSALYQEFALLRPLADRTNAATLLQSLAKDWPVLYQLAHNLSSQSENYDSPPLSEPEIELATNYTQTSAGPIKKVAETSAAYAVPSMANITPEPKPLDIIPLPLNQAQTVALTQFIQARLIISSEKIAEILTHLTAEREVLLFGPPGSGKTRLARLLAGQLGALQPGTTPEAEADNYTLATATAEWSIYDTIGGIKPDIAEDGAGGLRYRFEPGVVARAAMACETSLKQTGRPHYLIIDEFNRANQERAFGELFTLIEYRDRPLLPVGVAGRAQPLYLPSAFRIIGTMNADDRSSLFETGFALRRRFALVEIEVPPPADERRFLPRSVQARLPQLSLLDGQTFADPYLDTALDIVVEFVHALRPNSHEAPSTGKVLGTALLIEVLVFCVVATHFYANWQDALEDAIIANLLPQLEHAPPAINRALTALADNPRLQDLKRVQTALERLKNNGFY